MVGGYHYNAIDATARALQALHRPYNRLYPGVLDTSLITGT